MVATTRKRRAASAAGAAPSDSDPDKSTVSKSTFCKNAHKGRTYGSKKAGDVCRKVTSGLKTANTIIRLMEKGPDQKNGKKIALMRQATNAEKIVDKIVNRRVNEMIGDDRERHEKAAAAYVFFEKIDSLDPYGQMFSQLNQIYKFYKNNNVERSITLKSWPSHDAFRKFYEKKYGKDTDDYVVGYSFQRKIYYLPEVENPQIGIIVHMDAERMNEITRRCNTLRKLIDRGIMRFDENVATQEEPIRSVLVESNVNDVAYVILNFFYWTALRLRNKRIKERCGYTINFGGVFRSPKEFVRYQNKTPRYVTEHF